MPWAAAAAIGGALISADAAGNAADSASESNAASTAASAKATADRLDFDKQQYADGASDRKFASDTARQMAVWQGEDAVNHTMTPGSVIQLPDRSINPFSVQTSTRLLANGAPCP